MLQNKARRRCFSLALVVQLYLQEWERSFWVGSDGSDAANTANSRQIRLRGFCLKFACVNMAQLPVLWSGDNLLKKTAADGRRMRVKNWHGAGHSQPD
jgi:hypothetical protein